MSRQYVVEQPRDIITILIVWPIMNIMCKFLNTVNLLPYVRERMQTERKKMI